MSLFRKVVGHCCSGAGLPAMERVGCAVARQAFNAGQHVLRANGFSKKVENLTAAVSLRFLHHNFARVRASLKSERGYPQTPAMGVRIVDHVLTLEEIARLLD